MRMPGALANRVNNGLKKGGQEEKVGGTGLQALSVRSSHHGTHRSTPPLRRLG